MYTGIMTSDLEEKCIYWTAETAYNEDEGCVKIILHIQSSL